MRKIKEEIEKIRTVASIIDSNARNFWKDHFPTVPSHVPWDSFSKSFCEHFKFEPSKKEGLSSVVSDNPSATELSNANKHAFESFLKKFPGHPLVPAEIKRRMLNAVLNKLELLIKEKNNAVYMDTFGIVCDTCNLFKDCHGPQKV